MNGVRFIVDQGWRQREACGVAPLNFTEPPSASRFLYTLSIFIISMTR